MTTEDKTKLLEFAIKRKELSDDIDTHNEHLKDLKNRLREHSVKFCEEIYKRKIALPIAFKINSKVVTIDANLHIKIFDSDAEITEQLDDIL